jgi:hypothetical protein
MKFVANDVIHEVRDERRSASHCGMRMFTRSGGAAMREIARVDV